MPRATKRRSTTKTTRSIPPSKKKARTRTPNKTRSSRFPIVGIGASAGGLEAFSNLLRALPGDTGLGFVFVQHLDPDHESALPQLLARATPMPVHVVTDNLRVAANHVYVIPPNTHLSIAQGRLRLQARRSTAGAARSIDSFFESLAQDQRGWAIGVILSGTASDGTLGLEAIKAEGGITFAQDASAKYDSMPHSAVAAGCVDFVLSPENIAKELSRIATHPYVVGGMPDLLIPSSEDRAPRVETMPRPSDAGGARRTDENQVPGDTEVAQGKGRDNSYKNIFRLLRNHSGVDFSLYKSTTILRRITRGMVLSKHDTLEHYADFLRGNAKELDALYSDALISVTSFFRNPEAFEVLTRTVFPALLQQRSDEPVRVWVLGCSAGQEAYSMAMAFMESAEHASRPRKLQMFATDLNEALLDKARHGLYAEGLLQDVSPERLRRFFVEEDGGYRVAKLLREQVVFARHNLIGDPPFSRMDVISCRNLLIYFEASAQKKVLPMFHYALKPGGWLLLGSSESIGTFTELFEPADKKHKLFRKRMASTPAFHFSVKEKEHGASSPAHRPSKSLPMAMREAEGTTEAPEGLRGELNAQREADRVMVNRFGPPSVVIDADLKILQFRGATNAYLAPPSGKATFDVLKMARGGLMLPLRAAIRKAKKENRAVRKEQVRVQHNGMPRTVNVEVIPLKNMQERCFLIVFEEAQAERPVSSEPARAPTTARTGLRRLSAKDESRRVSALERELAEARDYLQNIQEQHEMATEELQASNEEVQSANEELQSLNEELETSKEELESANEELTTVNEEIVNRNTELNRLTGDLVNLQNSTKLAIVLVGRDLTIRRFSAQAEKQFNLLAMHIGRPIGNVRHTLDLRDLESLIVEVIDTVREQEREVRDTDGRWYSLRVRPYLTLDNKVDGAVLVLMDIDVLKRSEQAIAAARDFAESIIDTVREPLVVLDAELRVKSANRAFYHTFEFTQASTVGRFLYELGHGQWDIPRLRTLLADILPRHSHFENFEMTQDFPTIGRRTMLLNGHALREADAMGPTILLGIQDVTEVLQFEAMEALTEELRESEHRFHQLADAMPQIVWTARPDGYIDYYNEQWYEFTGFPREEFGQFSWEPILHPDDVRRSVDTYFECIREGKPYQIEYRFKDRFKGGYRWFMGRALPIRNERGEILKWFGTCTDIDDIKQAEHTLKEADVRKNEFLAMVSHELRTPLNSIYGWTTLLLAAEVPEEKMTKALTIIRRNAKDQIRLIEDLLDVSRIMAGQIKLQMQPVDVVAIVETVLESMRPVAEAKGLSLEQVPGAQTASMSGDGARLEQVLRNILENAVKFTPKGGRIRVKVEQENSHLEITVSDTGQGIKSEVLPYIFDQFRQGDSSLTRQHGGLGLGLAIVQEIVRLHGGAVSAESQGEGQGATFRLRFPRVPISTETTREQVVVRPQLPADFHLALDCPPELRGLRVLVVDDDQGTLDLLETLFHQCGCEVKVALSAEAGLAEVQSWAPHLIVADIGMPGTDGYAFIDKVRQLERAHDRMTPAIALTAYVRPEDRIRALSAGYQAHVGKPLDFLELLAVAASLAGAFHER